MCRLNKTEFVTPQTSPQKGNLGIQQKKLKKTNYKPKNLNIIQFSFPNLQPLKKKKIQPSGNQSYERLPFIMKPKGILNKTKITTDFSLNCSFSHNQEPNLSKKSNILREQIKTLIKRNNDSLVQKPMLHKGYWIQRPKRLFQIKVHENSVVHSVGQKQEEKLLKLKSIFKEISLNELKVTKINVGKVFMTSDGNNEMLRKKKIRTHHVNVI